MNRSSAKAGKSNATFFAGTDQIADVSGFAPSARQSSTHEEVILFESFRIAFSIKVFADCEGMIRVGITQKINGEKNRMRSKIMLHILGFQLFVGFCEAYSSKERG